MLVQANRVQKANSIQMSHLNNRNSYLVWKILFLLTFSTFELYVSSFDLILLI